MSCCCNIPPSAMWNLTFLWLRSITAISLGTTTACTRGAPPLKTKTFYSGLWKPHLPYSSQFGAKFVRNSKFRAVTEGSKNSCPSGPMLKKLAWVTAGATSAWTRGYIAITKRRTLLLLKGKVHGRGGAQNHVNKCILEYTQVEVHFSLKSTRPSYQRVMTALPLRGLIRKTK